MLRRMWRVRMRRSRTPLARAKRTYSWVLASTTPVAVRRSTRAMLASARLMAGRIRWAQPSRVNSENGTPSTSTVSPRPEAGSQCSHAPNIRISIMPCQKLGSEKPSTEPPISVRPSGRPSCRPASRPSGMPSRQVRPMATSTSSKVAGMRWAISSMAPMPCTKEVPRSPCSARATKLKYCSHTGRFRPRRAIMAWRSASLASALTNSSIGSPTA